MLTADTLPPPPPPTTSTDQQLTEKPVRSLSLDEQLRDFPSLDSIRERRNSTSCIFDAHHITPPPLYATMSASATTTTATTTSTEDEEKGGLVVSGLPGDVTEREFENLFCFAHGFEGAWLVHDSDGEGVVLGLTGSGGGGGAAITGRTTTTSFMSVGMPNIWSCGEGSSPPIVLSNLSSTSQSTTQSTNQSPTESPRMGHVVGMAQFSNRLLAMAARDHLHGRTLDHGQTRLTVHLKGNGSVFGTVPEMVPTVPRRHSTFTPSTNHHHHHMMMNPNRYQQLLMYTTGQVYHGYPPNYIMYPVMHNQGNQQQPPTTTNTNNNTPNNNNQSCKKMQSENPPCNTLYVGNLPPMATEDELRMLFAPCPGFKRLSFRHKPNGPMCFVEFDDIEYATAAMEMLYGTMLSCSTVAKGGIRLSYSKNPLGVRSMTGIGIVGVGIGGVGVGMGNAVNQPMNANINAPMNAPINAINSINSINNINTINNMNGNKAINFHC